MTSLTQLTDVQVALFTALVVVLIFVLASSAQSRRAPRLVAPEGATSAGLHLIDERISGFENRITPRLTAIEDRQKLVDERQKSTEHDVRNIRTALQALPSKDAVHRLEVQLTALNGKLETAEAVGIATQRAVDRIVSHLMKET